MDSTSRETTKRYYARLNRGWPGGGATLESASGLESSEASVLGAERARAAYEQAVKIAEREWAGSLDPELLKQLEKVYLADGLEGLKRLRGEGDAAELSEENVAGLEAIIETDGSRPTIQVDADNSIDTDDALLRMWKSSAVGYASQISQVAASVGRIDLNGKHHGTGFVVGEDIVLTNRHVLQEVATVDGTGSWTFKGSVTIAFDANPDQCRTREFPVNGVLLTGKDAIGYPIDYNKLDFAILQCDASGGSWPAPLTLESDATNIVAGRPVFAIGYPAKPPPGAYKFSVLNLLFRNIYGVKRFAPGEIDLELGDKSATVFAHDATTLGGNSGSCVADFGDTGLSIAGLQFAGFSEKANYAHATATLKASFNGIGICWQ